MSASFQAESEIPTRPGPRIIATIGLHGSASTWVFNVTRRILTSALGNASVSSLYADQASELPTASHPASHILIKSHHGSSELDEWLKSQGSALLLSIRDPRDAALSMSQRFETPLQHTAIWLRNDCDRVLKILPESHLLLKFEDRFFDEQASLDKIASCLHLPVEQNIASSIFEQYRTDAVRSFAAQISQLPRERIAMVGKFQMDRVTQILSPHIGDARSGKWRELAPPVRNRLTQIYRPFLERFGYPLN